MHTKLGFPLIPVPSYLPNMHELECSDVRKIEDTAFAEARRVESEMLIIMDELQENQEQQDISNASFHSSFSRIQSDELNDMGYGLNRTAQSHLREMHSKHQTTGHRVELLHLHLGRRGMSHKVDQ